MWRLLALGAFVLAVQVPTAWYLEDIEGTLRPEELACPSPADPRYLHVQLRAAGEGYQAVAVNPAEFETYLYLASPIVVETHAVRWDGRLAAPTTETFPQTREHPEVVLPAESEMTLFNGTLPEDGGARVVRWQLDWLCAVERFG